MKLFGKKALSLLLAFMMAFSMCSVAVFAEENYELTLNKSELNLSEQNKSETLEVTLPTLEDGSTPDVQWSVEPAEGVVTYSSDGSHAEKLNITAVANGEATITAQLNGYEESKVACTVKVTSDKPFAVALAEEYTLEVPYNTRTEAVVARLKAIGFVFSYGSEESSTTETKGIDNWKCDNYKATALGEYVFIGTVDGAWGKTLEQQISVHVVPAVIDEQVALDEVRIPLNLTEEEICERLTATVKTVKLKSGDQTIQLNLNDSDCFGEWTFKGDSFDKNYKKGDRFVFFKRFQSDFDVVTGIEQVEVSVVADDEDVGTVNVKVPYNSYDNGGSVDDLNKVISDHIEAFLKEHGANSNTSYIINITANNEDMYGNIAYTGRNSNPKYYYYVSLSSANEQVLKRLGTLSEPNCSFTAVGSTDGQTYEGTLQIVILDSFDITAEWEDTNFSFTSQIVSKIRNNLKSLYGNSSELDYVCFENIDTDGGVLYESSADNADEIESDRRYYYQASSSKFSLTKLYYVPAGNGVPFTASYVAYSTVEDEYITGTIIIESPEILTLNVDITNEEVYQLSSEELQAVIDELDTDYTLDYITFDNVSTSYGALYYQYDAAVKNNAKASTSKKYYVEVRDRTYYAIDEVTFVPKTNVNKGTAIVNFEATVLYGKNNKYSAKIPGVLTINIQEEADIVYKTGINTAITFSADDFVNFLKKNVSGSNLTLNSVEFDGLPASTTLGYMYDGNTTTANRISKPDNKTFYYQPSGSKLDLDNLTWLAGTKAGTQHVEFTVYYTKGSNKTTYNKTGYLDLVAENAVTTKQSIKASELYQKFQSDMKSAGASYVEFTSVTGGKLMYNFCQSTQEAVKTGTYYYVSGTGAQKQLAYVSFVPAYGATSGKVTMKGYDTKGTCVIFEYQFTITAVNSSAYFKDVTATSYGAYAKSVDLLYYLKIVQGNSTTSLQFNPTGTLTRGEWIAMLYRAAGSPAVYGTNSFTDVPSWCKDAVQWAVQNGITTGTSATTFEPNMQLDRMQIALFLYRWAQKLGLDTTGTVNLNTYTDGSTVPAWATTAMQWALKNGYLDTVSGQVKPRDYTTRAVIADCLHRILVK